jgi:hypothetical protein
MATLNKLSDLSTIGNTGVGGLFFDPKIIIGAFLCPKGFELDISSIQANLVAATHNSTKRSRIYPIYDFLSPKDATEDKIMQQFNTGAKKPVREGYNDWSFQFVQGGVDLLQNLRNFNGSLWDFIFVDSLNRLIGITGSSATKLRAVPSDGGFFWANPWKSNDGTKVTEYMVQFVFNVKYLNNILAFVEAGFDVQTTINGLQDVNLAVETGGVAGTYKLTAKTKVGLNLAELYPTIMNVAARYVVKNPTTGNPVTVSTVTIGTNIAGEACFVLAVDTADTDYTAATNVSFNLVDPATLQAAGVDGYESTGAVQMAKN